MTLTSQDQQLVERRNETIGPYTPLFYEQPKHFVKGEGCWLQDNAGTWYLDAYNNVPQVGHANPRVAESVGQQLATYQVHTRYLHEAVVDYAEELLATFDESLNRVYFTNSGSEANDLALRIAKQITGNTGVIVTDWSYHGNTLQLAELTTGLDVSNPLADWVRAITIPDVNDPSGTISANDAVAQVRDAVASLQDRGHGLAALLIEPIFSTEGLPDLPPGYLEQLVEICRDAGGVIIADEVQAGMGRMGDVMWGHQAVGINPDMVTMGKPLGNGYPLGGVVTGSPMMDAFSAVNMYFNTFAGTPAAAAAGRAVLAELADQDLLAHAGDLGRYVRTQLEALHNEYPRITTPPKGRGLFFGLGLRTADGQPAPELAKQIVEGMLEHRIIISKIGRNDEVLKIRPPLVIQRAEIDALVTALDAELSKIEKNQ